MTTEFDNEFDKYLEGDSEISRLYAQSKKNRVSEQLSDEIIKIAQTRPETAKITPIKKPARKNYVVPFSVAATVLLSFGAFKYFAPVEQVDEKQVLSLVTETEPAYSQAELSKERLKESDVVEIDSIGSGINAPNNIEIEEAVKEDSRDPAAAPVKIINEDSSSLLALKEQANKEMVASNSSKPTADQTVATLESFTVTNEPADSETARDRTHVAKAEVVEESPENDEVDYSLDWMNQLSTGTPQVAQLTKQTSNALTEKEWIKKILKLHETNKHDEAAKNIKEFRKLYPHYRLPKVLHQAYE